MNHLILNFNFLLERKTPYYSLNESTLEHLINQLDDLAMVQDEAYWLTLARIHELALLCAENYADNGELGLVGDLLFNPRLILVHIRGQERPVVKKRHTPLTEQFHFMAETAAGVMNWVKTEVVLETRVEALLPDLYQQLESAGVLAQDYFESVKKRQAGIVEWTTFFSTGGFADSLAFYHWFNQAGSEDRALAESKRCPCDTHYFKDLGRRIQTVSRRPARTTGFQRPAPLSKGTPFFPAPGQAGDSLWTPRA
jgi:hypothetical protein